MLNKIDPILSSLASREQASASKMPSWSQIDLVLLLLCQGTHTLPNPAEGLTDWDSV